MSPKLQPGLQFEWQTIVPEHSVVPELFGSQTPFAKDMPSVMATGYMVGLMERSAGEVATRTPKTVPPGMLAVEAMRVMNDAGITVLVVVDAAGAPVGILRIHDCLRAGVA